MILKYFSVYIHILHVTGFAKTVPKALKAQEKNTAIRTLKLHSGTIQTHKVQYMAVDG